MVFAPLLGKLMAAPVAIDQRCADIGFQSGQLPAHRGMVQPERPARTFEELYAEIERLPEAAGTGADRVARSDQGAGAGGAREPVSTSSRAVAHAKREVVSARMMRLDVLGVLVIGVFPFEV